ncbi:MAG: CotH kinase family protein, partial [Bacteroidetes bacterium]|nr:CotH kinase family protein [Bacteroidota bacterium]
MNRLIRISLLFLILFLSSILKAQTLEDFYNINTVQEIRISFVQKNWSDILDSLIQDGDGSGRLLGDVTINGLVFKGVGIRYKGFSSWDVDNAKNPFNIELDYTIKYKNYQGYTKLKLSNVIHDPSFVREVLAYEISRKYMPASKANFANVYVNDTLLGLYTNVEAVDKDFAERKFGSQTNSFFKGSPNVLQYPFGQNSNLANTHGNDSSGYIPYYKMESDFGWNDLYDFIHKLNVDTSQIESVLNIDRTLWMHAINYTLLNLDSYIGYSQNFYIYKDDNGRFNPILWDLNMSFGSFRYSDGISLNLTIPKIAKLNPLQYLSQASYTPRPLIKNVLNNTTNSKMYIAHMRTIINENIKNNTYFNRGQAIQDSISQFVQNDTNKFYSFTDFGNNLTSNITANTIQYPGIKDLMEARIAYLDTFPGFFNPPSISQINYSPSTPNEGENLLISAKVIGASKVILSYRFKTNGLFSKILMYDDGNHNDGLLGDSIFGASILTAGDIIQYYFYAENDSNGIFSPERAEFEFYSVQPKISKGDITINEICSNWIELYNNTKENLRLKDIYLSDDSANIQNWPIPDTAISPKGYFMIEKSLVNSGFAVQDNGSLYLAYDENGLIDSINFGEIIENKTIGRFPNGVGAFVYMNPTYSSRNSSGIIIEFGYTLFPNPAT